MKISKYKKQAKVLQVQNKNFLIYKDKLIQVAPSSLKCFDFEVVQDNDLQRIAELLSSADSNFRKLALHIAESLNIEIQGNKQLLKIYLILVNKNLLINEFKAFQKELREYPIRSNDFSRITERLKSLAFLIKEVKQNIFKLKTKLGGVFSGGEIVQSKTKENVFNKRVRSGLSNIRINKSFR